VSPQRRLSKYRARSPSPDAAVRRLSTPRANGRAVLVLPTRNLAAAQFRAFGRRVDRFQFHPSQRRPQRGRHATERCGPTRPQAGSPEPSGRRRCSQYCDNRALILAALPSPLPGSNMPDGCSPATTRSGAAMAFMAGHACPASRVPAFAAAVEANPAPDRPAAAAPSCNGSRRAQRNPPPSSGRRHLRPRAPAPRDHSRPLFRRIISAFLSRRHFLVANRQESG
jgi:hypothetical protein